MKVEWPNDNLQVFQGDEIEIMRGVGEPTEGQIKATAIRNKTRGKFLTTIEGFTGSRKTRNYVPPLHGYVKNVVVGVGTTKFDLEDKP